MKKLCTTCSLVALALCIMVSVQTFGGSKATDQQANLRAHLIADYAGRKPNAWGMRLPGVLTQLPTKERVMALTFDACGGSRKGNGFDRKLIDYLVREKIPATLFLSGKWIDANPEAAKELAENPLFDIENHGLNHRPCSVNGRAAYGIRGTISVQEVIDEVQKNAEKIEALTNRRPGYYRAGTASYDNIAVQVVKQLCVTPVGFTVSGDGGATFSREKIANRLIHAASGSIVLCHMNHPEGHTAEGIAASAPLLKKKGFRFVKLSNYLSTTLDNTK
jgi:peptidoglycan/xylan/chitin deacetylase (PgdA/CDA1 family)